MRRGKDKSGIALPIGHAAKLLSPGKRGVRFCHGLTNSRNKMPKTQSTGPICAFVTEDLTALNGRSITWA